MTETVLATIQDCEDLAYGLVLLGTGGGGGTPQMTIDMLSREIGAGQAIRLVDIATDVLEDAWTVTVAGMGARPTSGGPTREELDELGLTAERYTWLDRLVEAVKELADYAGVSLGAIVPGEMGCFNTAVPIVAAARLNIPIVDGDYAGGRAIPELGQMIPEIHGVPTCPMAFVDRWGDIVFLKEARSSAMADRIARLFCEASFEGVGAAWYLLMAKDARDVMARKSLSRALGVGRARREALERGADPVQAIVEHVAGWLLFEGEVLEGEKEKQEQAVMFNIGTHHMRGIEAFEGEKLDIFYKNENHVAWRNGTPYVTSPDLICILDLDTGEGKPTYDVIPGLRVAVIGMRAHPAHRTEKGIRVLGPRHFGHDIDYTPIEAAVGRWSRKRSGRPGKD